MGRDYALAFGRILRSLISTTNMRSLLHTLKRHWRKTIIFCLAICLSAFVINWWMIRANDVRVFTSTDLLPQNEVGLVLGSSPRLKNGAANWHFNVRIAAAVKLYQAGKIRHLLLSGDNHAEDYDEPTEMKIALLQRGIPADAMTLDCAGFRTLDSVERARKIFGQEKITIITEDFHAHRSAFLAQHAGMDAVVFCAESLGAKWSARSKFREAGARVKAALDVYVLHTRPRFLGDKIEIKVSGRTGGDLRG